MRAPAEHEVLDEAVKHRLDPIVAFQGARGAYADLAIERVWGSHVRRMPCRDFEGVVAAVTAGDAHYGVLPIRNAIIGEIPGVAAALSRASLTVQQHVVVPVVHCLLAVPGATLEGLRTVFSHPAALGQCQSFVADHPWLTAVPSYDTAGAALEVSSRRHLWEGAIADEQCAARYGLEVLAREVGDREGNHTQFAVLTLDADTVR
ncbi:MAG: prephenate dehydratase domain-containing protein [Gemmatimonadaceae bacterium]